jgi:hypothetical protein
VTRVRVCRRQAAYHSRRRRWPEKREAFRTECALEAHRRSLERRLEENEKFDDITLKVAKFAISKVVAALNELQQLSLPAPASLLETLVRTTERAQKIAKLAMSLPTELLEHKDRADAARSAAVLEAPSDNDDPILRLIAKIERLEGEQFLAAIDGLMGATPAGHRSYVLVVRRFSYAARMTVPTMGRGLRAPEWRRQGLHPGD